MEKWGRGDVRWADKGAVRKVQSHAYWNCNDLYLNWMTVKYEIEIVSSAVTAAGLRHTRHLYWYCCGVSSIGSSVRAQLCLISTCHMPTAIYISRKSPTTYLEKVPHDHYLVSHVSYQLQSSETRGDRSDTSCQLGNWRRFLRLFVSLCIADFSFTDYSSLNYISTFFVSFYTKYFYRHGNTTAAVYCGELWSCVARHLMFLWQVTGYDKWQVTIFIPLSKCCHPAPTPTQPPS